MYIKTKVCVNLLIVHFYNIHPIAIKLWELIEYPHVKVSGIVPPSPHWEGVERN